MYEKCINCPDLGTKCDGPNFVAMNTHDMLDWIRQRKAQLRWTNSKLAELSKIPKGTIDGLLAGDRVDVKLETVRPILQALVGGRWDDNPCPEQDVVPDAATHETIALQAAHIKHLEERLQHTELEMERSTKYLLDQLKSRKAAILALSIALGITMTLIITALIIDSMDPTRGFFWMEQLSNIMANIQATKL